MRRPGGADFAPGAYVFPGGSAQAEDLKSEDEIRTAAVRELFEEVGILLARFDHGFSTQQDCERIRMLLAEGMTFGQALHEAELRPAFDELVLLARWVTPLELRRRFDARFFLARLPAGQAIRAQEGEVTGWLWVAPADALRDAKLTLVYATRTVLESVATGEAASEVIERARLQGEVPAVQPRLVRTESGWKIEP